MTISTRLPIASLLILAGSFMAIGCSAVDDSDQGVAWVSDRGDAETAAIIGGTQASEYPEAALVNMNTGSCSGSVIAPRVVLTAGHCIAGTSTWSVIAPYAGGQASDVIDAAVFDYTSTTGSVDPDAHDVGVLILADPIKLNTYPTVYSGGLANTTFYGINIGRKQDGVTSFTDLYKGKSQLLKDGADKGFKFAYYSDTVIEPGDSGGPVMLPGSKHVILGVNSGASPSFQVVARVDQLSGWIAQQITANGGYKVGPTPPPPPSTPPNNDPPATEPPPPAPDGCQGFDYAGSCQPDGYVVWCEDNKLYGIDCDAKGQTCGTNSNGVKDCL